MANVGLASDTITGDADLNNAANPNCVIRCYLIGVFSGRYITSIDVDANNAGHVVVSLGSYGVTNYVYYSAHADTATSAAAAAFANRSGNLSTLGGVPTYTVSFDKYSANRVLVGTDHGVYETSDITAVSPVWFSANTNLDNTIVTMIRQERWDPWLVPDAGCFYIGTHGRGMWRDDDSWQVPTGINNPADPSANSSSVNNHDLKVFPNPVIDNSNVVFNLSKAGNADVMIFDLGGKLVYSKKYDQLAAGTNTVQFDSQSLDKGTYIIVVMQDEKKIGAGRFVKID